MVKTPLAFVVDDDRSLSEAYAQALEMCGFRTRTIDDSTHALTMVLAYQPDLVMLDMQMPKVNGLEVLQSIRSHRGSAQTRVIVTTANRHMLNETVEELADLVLLKPVSLAQIRLFARRMLQSDGS